VNLPCGFADVYLGEHVFLKTQAAIKLLQMKVGAPDDLDSFLKEAQTVARLVHPHIVRVLNLDWMGKRLSWSWTMLPVVLFDNVILVERFCHCPPLSPMSSK